MPIIGQLGAALVPAVHSISMSISHMTHDSIEEIFQRTCHENDPTSQLLPPPSLCEPIAILIDLEGVGMDDSLAPLSRLERGKCLEIWCGGARGERHRGWYRMTKTSGSWLGVSQARDQSHRHIHASRAPKPCEDPAGELNYLAVTESRFVKFQS